MSKVDPLAGALPPKPMEGWLYAGVDYDLPGTGGQACAEYLSLKQRFVESCMASVFGLLVMWVAYTKATLPKKESIATMDHHNRLGKRILLVVMCLTFGIELGFKFATRQVIWIFNPCHLATMIQIYLLAAPPGPWTTAVFRLHMHMLTGAPIALLFPVVNTRLGYFDCVRTELEGEGIRVTSVCPGPVFSNILDQAFTGKKGKTYGGKMSKDERRVTSERCAFLTAVAVANCLDEVWISLHPVLVFTYFNQYFPALSKRVAVRLGMKQILKMRQG